MESGNFRSPILNQCCWVLFIVSKQNPADGKGMNLRQVWQQGITGKGVVVAVVDDGLQQSHPELRDNYVSLCLW